MKFTINKQTNLRKSYNDKGECTAIFGVAEDMLKANVLLSVAKGYEQKIVAVMAPDYRTIDFDTIEEAKKFLSNFNNGL